MQHDTGLIPKSEETNWLLWMRWLWIILCLVLLARAFLMPTRQTVHHNYTSAGRHWWNGTDAYELHYLPNGQLKRNMSGYRYSPLVSAFFVPFALLPDRLGNLLWRILKLLQLHFRASLLLSRGIAESESSQRQAESLVVAAAHAVELAQHEQRPGQRPGARLHVGGCRRGYARTLESGRPGAGRGVLPQALSRGSVSALRRGLSAPAWLALARRLADRPGCAIRACSIPAMCGINTPPGTRCW